MADESNIPYAPDLGRVAPTFNSDNKEFTMSLNIFNGNASFSMFRKDQRGRPIVAITIDHELAAYYPYLTEQLIKGGPNNHYKLLVKKFNPDSKSWEESGTLIIGKDEKGGMFIELGSVQQPPVRFSLRPSRKYQVEGVTDTAIGSVLIAKKLAADIRDMLSTWQAMSKNKNAPKQFGGGGGGSYNRGGQSGGGNYGGGNRGGYGQSGGGNNGESQARAATVQGDDDVF